MDEQEYAEFQRRATQASFEVHVSGLLEWFVKEGADVGQVPESEENLIEIDLRGIRYFIGPSTAEAYSGICLEMAALIYEDPPFDRASLEEMVRGLNVRTEDEDPICFIEFADEAVWFTFRMNREMLIDEEMLNDWTMDFIQKTERIVEAIH